MTSQAVTGQGMDIYVKVVETATIQFIASTKKLTRTVGSWLDKGLAVGQAITTSDASNLIVGNITVLSALEITVDGTVVDSAAGVDTVTSRARIGEIQSFDGPGGAANIIDVSSLDSTAKEKRVGLQDEGQFKISGNLVWSDPGQISLRELRRLARVGLFEVVYTDPAATTASFDGLVQEWTTSGGVDDVLHYSSTIEITGPVVYT